MAARPHAAAGTCLVPGTGHDRGGPVRGLTLEVRYGPSSCASPKTTCGKYVLQPAALFGSGTLIERRRRDSPSTETLIFVAAPCTRLPEASFSPSPPITLNVAGWPDGA